jgi:hypothetical protein
MGKAFGFEDRKTASFVIGDPGADNKQIRLFRAPNRLSIMDAWIVSTNAQGAGTATEWMLHNFGTAGTAIKSSGGTIGAMLGGTASPLSGGVPSQFTLTNTEMADGEWLVADYQEDSDWSEGAVTVFVEYIDGEASTS